MRNARNFLAAILLGVVCLSGSSAWAADSKPEGKDDGSTIGEIRTQKLKGFTFFYGTMRVTLLTFPFKLAVLLPDLQKALDSVHARATGPMVLIFRGALDDAAGEYDVEIGFPVAEKTPGVKDFKVRDVPEYDCMSVLYTGSLGGILGAYEKLVPAAEDASGKPAEETRLMFLYVEGANSSNNVLHVSVGVKK